jgi:DNA-binding transcriptional ArsR family regulator
MIPRAPDPDAHLDAVFAALADPTRRAIVTRLLAGDHTVSDLAEPFEMSLAAVSKHLGILTRAGIVSQRREGRTKWCRLEVLSLRPAAVWMEAFGSFDAADLETLEELFALAEALPAAQQAD